jgi:hypothetical protein
MIFMVIVQHWMIAGLVGVFERRAPVDSLIRMSCSSTSKVTAVASLCT